MKSLYDEPSPDRALSMSKFENEHPRKHHKWSGTSPQASFLSDEGLTVTSRDRAQTERRASLGTVGLHPKLVFFTLSFQWKSLNDEPSPDRTQAVSKHHCSSGTSPWASFLFPFFSSQVCERCGATFERYPPSETRRMTISSDKKAISTKLNWDSTSIAIVWWDVLKEPWGCFDKKDS